MVHFVLPSDDTSQTVHPDETGVGHVPRRRSRGLHWALQMNRRIANKEPQNLEGRSFAIDHDESKALLHRVVRRLDPVCFQESEIVVTVFTKSVRDVLGFVARGGRRATLSTSRLTRQQLLPSGPAGSMWNKVNPSGPGAWNPHVQSFLPFSGCPVSSMLTIVLVGRTACNC